MRIDHPTEPTTSSGLEARPVAPRPPTVPPDAAPCRACLEEMHAAGGRRHRYAFTHCSTCGPRYAIATGLPYDRRHTSMRTFVMCNECAREYDAVDDRRHHAQPIACPTCGPTLSFRDRSGRIAADGEAAFDSAIRTLEEGGVLAIRGGGGFQLVCNAADVRAISRMRSRKGTPPSQPIAVMFCNVEQLTAHAFVTDEEVRVLSSPAAPIVLVKRREQTSVGDAVAPNVSTLGAMLPSTGLHALLLERISYPLACTSGNLWGEPMATSTDEALGALDGVADGFLCHDLPIVRPLEDSIVRVGPRRTTVLRRGRGHAPRSCSRIDERTTVLAVGARLENTVSLAHRGALVSSAHLGDVVHLRSRELLESTVRDLCAFFEADPTLIACDLHPEYLSTLVAQDLSERWGVPLLRVQHQHAHVAAVLAEHEVAEDEPVLGLAWDGPALGPDATFWGGEALLCQGAEFRRIGMLRSFPILGGDRAALEPRRSLLGLLFETVPAQLAIGRSVWSDVELASQSQLLERQLAPMTSSVARLLDAVGNLLGLPARTGYEGQAATELEQLVSRVAPDGAYPLPLVDDGVLMGDTRLLVEAILEDLRADVDRARIARRVYESLMEFGLALAGAAGAHRVALAGSVFQGRLLAEGLEEKLERAGFEVLMPTRVPATDGGISVGQAWLAARSLHRRAGS